MDACQRLFARNAVVGEDQIQIDRQARHVADEQVDGGATLERERAVRENERRDLDEQARRVEIDLVHGLSTSRPSAEWDTQARAAGGQLRWVQLRGPRQRQFAPELQAQAHRLDAGATHQQVAQHVGTQAVGTLREFARFLYWLPHTHLAENL